MMFILILIFYFLVLAQISFFPHLFSFNLILLLVILINIFESEKRKTGLVSAFFGGFFLDIFSENFIGFWILILMTLSCLIKFGLKKYVQISFPERI